MNNFVHIGFGNFVAVDKIRGIYTINTNPIKTKVALAKDLGTIEDLTKGKATKSVLMMNDGTIVLSGINPKTLIKRIQCPDFSDEDEE